MGKNSLFGQGALEGLDCIGGAGKIPSEVPPGVRSRIDEEDSQPGRIEPVPIDIDIAHIARLARLDLSDQDLERYGQQCADILEHAARVSAFDTEGVEPTAHPMAMSNRLREDLVTPETVLDRDEVLSQAPDAQGEYFRVPPALEDE